jgi:sec-independent protein translocase protein TatC
MERKTLFRILNGLRRVLYRSLLFAAIFGAISFAFSKKLILLFTEHINITLYYFSLSEVFFSAVELALYMGIFFSVPVIVLFIWHEFRKALRGKQIRGYLFIISAIFLFYLGSLFCYFVVLPSGITFLLSYQGGAIKATISTIRFVHFCISMIFAFGVAFELPLVLLLLGKMGVVTSRRLSKMRRYAVLLIVVASSIVTPTPDVYNMSLLAGPLYILYEVGILLLKIGERNLTRGHKSV